MQYWACARTLRATKKGPLCLLPPPASQKVSYSPSSPLVIALVNSLELHEGLEGQWSLLPLTWPRCPFKSCPLTFNNFQGKCPSQNVSGLVLALLKMKFQSYSTCPLKISFRILNLPQGGALYFWKIFLEQRISPEQMFMTLLTISKLSGPNFLKPASTKKLLSTEKHCLTKNRLPAKLTLGLTWCYWCPTQFLLSKTICQAIFSAKQLYEIVPWAYGSREIRLT